MSLSSTLAGSVVFMTTALEQCGLITVGAATGYPYHCVPPEDCCTEDGTITASWRVGYPSDRFPGRSQGTPCPGKPVFTIDIRYWECWQGTPDGVITDPIIAGAQSMRLADIAECGLLALLAEACGDAPVFGQCCPGWFQVGDVIPICVQGGCAGVGWTVTVGLCEIA